jgi:two-component system OmpR family sensor kinase
MHSIESRLRQRLLMGSVALSVALALTAWWWVGRQVRDLLDYQLEQVARALVDHDFSRSTDLSVDDPAMHLDVVVWDGDGKLLYRSSPLVELSPGVEAGFSRVPSGPQPDAVLLRLFTLRAGGRVIQVAHPVSLRQDLAREAGLEMLGPALGGTLALSLLIVVTVRRSLAPLRDLGRELSSRGADALGPIRLPHAPDELQAPLATLNALLGRLKDSLALHRQFIADAAHELRTPLAAVRLQAENAAKAGGEDERGAAMKDMRLGIERLQRLVGQLLELARLESSVPRREPVDVIALARDCLVDHAVPAAARGIELSLEGMGDGSLVHGDPRGLRTLLDNLVGNAIKYAPADSVVTIAVQPAKDGVRLAVRDHGPGIAPELRQRVLERFQRGAAAPADTGSGLGLAIAAEAARQHGAALELLTPADGRGLEARVVLPAQGAIRSTSPAPAVVARFVT